MASKARNREATKGVMPRGQGLGGYRPCLRLPKELATAHQHHGYKAVPNEAGVVLQSSTNMFIGRYLFRQPWFVFDESQVRTRNFAQLQALNPTSTPENHCAFGPGKPEMPHP